MWITTEQAAEMYARFCRARYGHEAIDIVKKRAAELRQMGDKDGERIWNMVAQNVETKFAPRQHFAA